MRFTLHTVPSASILRKTVPVLVCLGAFALCRPDCAALSLLIEPELQLIPSELKALAEPADVDVRGSGAKINAFAQFPSLGILAVSGAGGGGGGVPSAASGNNPNAASNAAGGSSAGGGSGVGSSGGQQISTTSSTAPGVSGSVPPVLNQGNSSSSSSSNGTANNVVIASVVAPVPDAAPTLVLLGLTTLGLLGAKWSRCFRTSRRRE